jgi:hypothetical protein
MSSEIQWSTTANNLITVCDQRNNFIWFDTNNGSISLKLSNEQRQARQIGSIWSLNEDSRVYSKVVNKRHFHRNTNSYGLNSIVINHILNDTDIILLYTNKKHTKGYMIPAKTVKEKAQYYDFGLKAEGTEKQLFYDIKNWEECK